MNQKYCNGWESEYLNTLKYATFKNKGKQLVLKSPPNTGRVSRLLILFPNAKFVYIYRNPFHIYYSMRNMWSKAVLKYYSLQKITKQELDAIIFEHFEHIIEQYEKGKTLIPEGNLTEVSYEELKADSFKTVRKIYSKLSLPDFELTINDLVEQLEMEKDYHPFKVQYNSEMLERINERWRKYILERGYEEKRVVKEKF